MAEGKAIKAVYRGDYSGLEGVHMGIDEYAKLSNIMLADYCWEVYLNQPGEVGDNELETHVYYRLKQILDERMTIATLVSSERLPNLGMNFSKDAQIKNDLGL